MHFTILTQVNARITDEVMQRVEDSKNKVVELDNVLATLPEDAPTGPLNKTSLSWKRDKYQELSNPLRCAIELELDNIMFPYLTSCTDMKYAEFIDETESLKQNFERNQVPAIHGHGKPFFQYQLSEKLPNIVQKNGAFYEKAASGALFRSQLAQKLSIQLTPVKDMYSSFKAYASDHATYNKKYKAYGYINNPHGMCDGAILVRQYEALLVLDSCQDCIPLAVDKAAPKGYKWVSAAKARDIQWEALPLARGVEESLKVTLAELFAGYIDSDEDVYDEYDGYYSCEWSEDFADEIFEFICNIPADSYIVCLDCHI